MLRSPPHLTGLKTIAIWQLQGVWEKDEVRKDDSFNTFEVSSLQDFHNLMQGCNTVHAADSNVGKAAGCQHISSGLQSEQQHCSSKAARDQLHGAKVGQLQDCREQTCSCSTACSKRAAVSQSTTANMVDFNNRKSRAGRGG